MFTWYNSVFSFPLLGDVFPLGSLTQSFFPPKHFKYDLLTLDYFLPNSWVGIGFHWKAYSFPIFSSHKFEIPDLEGTPLHQHLWCTVSLLLEYHHTSGGGSCADKDSLLIIWVWLYKNLNKAFQLSLSQPVFLKYYPI